MSMSTLQTTGNRNAILPAELLCMIFRLLASEVFHENLERRYEEVKGSRDCITITHVCRFWRTVAIGDAFLWGYDLCSPPRWIDTKLKRSRNAPLYIRWAEDDWKRRFMYTRVSSMSMGIEQGLRTAFEQSDRLREVYLEDCSSRAPPSNHSYPHLISLELGPKWLVNRGFIWRFPDYYREYVEATLPPPSSLPALKNLRLARRPLSWTNLQGLSNLVNLRLEQERGGLSVTRTKNHRTQVLQVLKSLPNLQSLILIHSLPYHREDESTSSSLTYGDGEYHIISFSHLHELVIYDTPKRCAWFLQHVSLPETAHLTVTGEVHPEWRDDDPDLHEPDEVGDDDFITFAGGYFDHNDEDYDEPALEALAIIILNYDVGEGSYAGPRKFLHLRAFKQMPCFFVFNLAACDSYADLTLTFSYPSRSYNGTPLFEQVNTGLPLEYITDLAIEIASPYQCDHYQWLDVFYAFNHLFNLSITGLEACAAFIRVLALNEVRTSPHAVPLKKPIWTRKRPHLILNSLGLLALREADLECRVDPEGYLTSRMFLRTLAARRARRRGKEFDLNLAWCRVRTLSVKQLMEIVPELQWDGREEGLKVKGEPLEVEEDGVTWSDGKTFVDI